MRRIIFAATALLVVLASIETATASAAVPVGRTHASTTRVLDASCDLSGGVAIDPGLLDTVGQPESFAFTGTLPYSSSCPTGSGAIKGTLQSPGSYCDYFAPLWGAHPTGILVITWADSTTSKLHLTMQGHPVPHNFDLVTLTGKVRKGRFAGDRVRTKLTVEPGQSCTSEPVTTWSFADQGAHTLALRFDHAG
jgi:hypothetical protein